MTDVWGDYQTASPRSSISQASNGMSSAASLVMSDINSSGVAHSQAPHPMGPSTAFTNLSSYIPPENRVLFTTPSALARQMATRISRCLRLGTGCYIHVSGVAEAKLDEIDDAFQDLGIRGSVRFTYEHDLEAMVIKCMPGEVHERASRTFMIKLAIKIAALPGHSEASVLPVGSTRFPVPGKRSKEGDEGIKPADTRADGNEWPSLMIEVGVSQALLSLRQDACWWLENSKERTRMVILIRIKKDPMSLRLERWERVIDTDRPSTRSRQKTTPKYTQHFDIDSNGDVSHAVSQPDLIIPYKSVFDTGYGAGTDIVLTKAELSEWSLRVFRGLGG